MNIFENLENLNVSEECFEDIINIVEEIINGEDSQEPSKKVRKNNKQRVRMRQDDPEKKNKIGVYKYYNRVIHDDMPDNPYSTRYVKIKGAKYSVDSRNNINQRLN